MTFSPITQAVLGYSSTHSRMIYKNSDVLKKPIHDSKCRQLHETNFTTEGGNTLVFDDVDMLI